MATINTDPISFNVRSIGTITGEIYEGVFKFKPFLSYRDRLARDSRRRQLLGEGESPTMDSAQIALALAEMEVRFTVTPSWWQSNGNGLDFLDENVVSDVFTAYGNKLEKFNLELKKEETVAKEALNE